MLDIQQLRNDLAGVAARLKTRGYILDTSAFERLEAERKEIQTRAQDLQAKRNAASKQIGAAKGRERIRRPRWLKSGAWGPHSHRSKSV